MALWPIAAEPGVTVYTWPALATRSPISERLNREYREAGLPVVSRGLFGLMIFAFVATSVDYLLAPSLLYGILPVLFPICGVCMLIALRMIRANKTLKALQLTLVGWWFLLIGTLIISGFNTVLSVTGVAYAVGIMMALMFDTPENVRRVGAISAACWLASVIIRVTLNPVQVDSLGEYTFLLLVPAGIIVVMSGAGQAAVWRRELALTLESEIGRSLEDKNMRLLEARDEAVDAAYANRAKTAFMEHMSHELRTPLNAIIGYSEIVIEDAREAGLDEVCRDIGHTRTAGKHLLQLIDDILDITRVESGKIQFFPETFDVKDMFEALVATVRPRGVQAAVVLRRSYDPELGEMHGDVTRVRQVLFNLLSNALKFTEKGVVKLTAERNVIDGVPWICVHVEDTGIGMTEPQMALIFEAFQQADQRIIRRFGGTGLGLAITQRLCVMMGGRVVVESKLGVGSKFSAFIPAHLSVNNGGDVATQEGQ